ncbi:hypothetical protein QJS10_CPB17g02019 [Acorus calamus]|uniref:Uncharacterized protein n=1 Tax=Acorus calamus TaxID=4465 RepID=A0AAV9CS30_ACOCL|nr:hypothetical protein QJS10_CPB17g02019 [Acorus calamus]
MLEPPNADAMRAKILITEVALCPFVSVEAFLYSSLEANEFLGIIFYIGQAIFLNDEFGVEHA